MRFDFANPEFLWALLILPVLAILRGAGGKSGSLIFSSVAIAREAARKIQRPEFRQDLVRSWKAPSMVQWRR